ncbi:MAG TPA: alpha/beta hydrolase, partial [Solirubrobacterales bacterium]
MEAETHYADSDGVSIAYQVYGDGPVDFVLVPGFVSHVELLTEDPATARFFRRLTAFSRLLVFDKRGQGLSDRPGRPPTLEESMDDLRAAVKAAGFERPAVLGISEGGPMSTLYAATYPDEISALILFGTFARMVETDGFPHGISDEQLDKWGSLVRRDWGSPVALDIWAPSRVGDGEFERWWARLLRQGTSPAGAIAL